MHGGLEEESYLSDINVTPFVDVLLVLLVIFIITLPLVIQTIPLNLPKSTLKQHLVVKEPAYIALNTKGEYFLNSQPLTVKDILTRLRALRDDGKLEMVIIQSDQANTYGKVVKLISLLKNEGFDKIGLSVANQE